MQSAVLGVQRRVNHKPRPPRAHLGALAPGLGAGAAQRLCGKAALRSGTETYVGDLFRHASCCRRRARAPTATATTGLLCGAVPLLEYSPLAVELLSGLPYIMVRSWAESLRAVLGAGARFIKNADLRLAAAHAGLLARRARARAD